MKHFQLLVIAVILIVASPLLAAEEAGHHHAGAQHDTTQQSTRLEGTIIGLTCFIKHDSQGESHKKCAQQCAEKGLPLALLADDGRLYQIMGAGHENLKSVNQPLLKYVESKVQVVGKTFEKLGQRVVVIEKIKQL